MSLLLAAHQISHRAFDGTADKVTLAPVTRSFEAGRFVAIGGPSGAGKSTLLSLLALTVVPDEGEVVWNGKVVSRLPADMAAQWRRMHVGLVFQHCRLIEAMTVADHIDMAAVVRRKPDARRRGLELLETLGLSCKSDRLPVQLSGGEKQRLALAQALCSNPDILLADEPTAALDQGNALIVAESLLAHARSHGAIVICVTHDQQISGRADDLLTLAKP